MARRPLLTPPNAHNGVIAETPHMPLVGTSDIIMSFATVADDIMAWGSNVKIRDQQLRQFWPTEPRTASAIFSITAKYSGFKWALQGPARVVGIYQEMLQTVENGAGWNYLWMKLLQDIFTQDNGAFIEVIRATDDPQSPCVSLNHLDSSRCQRTGHKMTPVLYYDQVGVAHLLKWYQVIPLEEMPSPIEILHGVQVCALSRILRAAQIMRDISVYKREKVSGRFNRGMFFVSGVQQKSINDSIRNQSLSANGQGLTRFVTPPIIASLDPTSTVKVDQIDFASLPDGYDEKQTLEAYIADLALAFGGDYQDFAPLPTGASGSSGQSRMLHQKSIGKGSHLFMTFVTQIMNYRGILPQNVQFRYTETDMSEDSQRLDMQSVRAKTVQVYIMSGIVTPEVGRQILADAGDLEYKYLLKLNESPIETDVSVSGDIPVHAHPELFDVSNPAKYEGQPDDQIIPGANTFGAGAVNGGDTSNMPKPADGGTPPIGKPSATTTKPTGASRTTGKP